MAAPDFSQPSFDSSLIETVDQTSGYLGIKLGTPLSQLEGLVFLENRAQNAVYTRPTDSLKVGQATLSYIEYMFRNEVLHDVYLGFDDEKNGTHLRDAFSRVYGRGWGTGGLVMWSGQNAEILYTLKDSGGYLAIGVIDAGAGQ